MRDKRNRLFSAIFILILLSVSLLISEVIFRYFIFSPSSPFKSLKDPGKYAKPSTDDYWKLTYLFGSEFPPPKNPDPLLGWVGFFHRKNYDHWYIGDKKDKRKVLIYGDSFIMCAHDSIQCFDEILNADTIFNKSNFLLNYGVGGYGVDQMHLLFFKTIDKFENPFVVFSIMPGDMDRSMLSVRTGQKPYFVHGHDSLELRGIPIDSIPDNFFKKNPPCITSYLWRRTVNSKLNPFYDPKPTNENLRNQILKLNKKIILKTYEEIKKRNLQYVFVIFDELWNEEGSWRADSLKFFFSSHNILCINTRDLIKRDTLYKKYDYFNYMIKDNGHPNSHYNKLLCEEIKKCISRDDATMIFRKQQDKNRNSIEYYEGQIRANKDWLKNVEQKAIRKNIQLDSMIKLDAVWMLEHDQKKTTGN